MKLLKAGLVFVAIFALGCDGVVDDGERATEELERELESEEIIDNLLLAGFPEREIEVREDGAVYVGSDAAVSLEASREMAGIATGARQYRTTNLMDTTGDTVVCVNPNAKFSNNAALSAALVDAVERYNAQGLSFTMQVGGGGCDFNITAKEVNGSGGAAGFPSGGQPYGTVNIGKSLANYGHDVTVHVITHELGHCIGFRHSDYFDRSISCGGSAVNEGPSNVGAIHIPGTPTGATLNGSVMNSCYNLDSDGVFTAGDVKALDELYGVVDGGGDGGGGGGGGGPGNGNGKGKKK